VTRLTLLDAAVGSPPSADVGLGLDSQKISLHDDFIADPVDSPMPDGALAVIGRHPTLDPGTRAVRRRTAPTPAATSTAPMTAT
jgi:hypothetical protein